jgi:integrase
MARKAQNIRRRGRGWIVYFRANGKQHMKSFADSKHGGEAGAREAAKLYLAQKQSERARGEFRTQTRIRFADFAAEWLRDYAQAHVRPKTYEGYEGVLRVHLVPHFGELLLTEITRKAIDAFVADWQAAGPAFQRRLLHARELEAARAREADRDPRPIRLGHSPKTIANALVPLREMLGHAVEWGYLTSNPADGVRRPRVESRHDEMRFLNVDQVGKLLKAAGDAACSTLVLTAVTTGMRRGELLGLRWGDVDWDARRVWVRRSVDAEGRFHQPKTRGSVRAIAMTSTLIAALREHRMASPFKELDDLVFPSERGTPLDGGNMVKRVLHPALRRAKLPAIRWHDLRHTYASLLIAQGAHPKLISEQLGHASISITLDRYGHLMDQSYGDASAQLEAALFGTETASVPQALPADHVPGGAGATHPTRLVQAV